MIPADFIAEWRAQTLWARDEQVEQDLVLSRALVAIFEDRELARTVALRGGTALHKLHFSPARRYSEDIDLVQLRPGPIGSTIDRVRAKLDPWLGEPKREQGRGLRLIYRFESEIPPIVKLRLKVETNTREHLAVRGTTTRPFAVESRWWRGSADITTFHLEELLGTKLRALFQRKKGRDLFDLYVALESGIDPAAIVGIFLAYMQKEGHAITRATFEENLAGKIELPVFMSDIPVLLPPGATFDLESGMFRVRNEIIALLPGEPWKGNDPRARKLRRPPPAKGQRR
jgi:predicted nucleotidyltransferase component of viral defense system